MNETTRIGLLLDGTQLKRWELWALQFLAEREDIALEVAFSYRSEPGAGGIRRQVRRLRKLPTHTRYLPWLTVDCLDRRFARRDWSADAMQDADLTDLPVSVPVIEAELDRTTRPGVHRFSEGDLARIREFDLDVLLRFGFNVLTGPVLQVARHGVWSFHHADNRVNRGAPPGFWEIANGDEVTGVTLQRLTEELDNGEVIARGSYPTDRTSWNRNHQRAAARGRTLLTDAIVHLAQKGCPPEVVRPPVAIYCHPLYRKPGPATALATALRTYTRPFGRKLQAALARTQWHIRWGPADPTQLSIHRLHRLVPPPDRLWADPFPHIHGSDVWLFVEELIYGEDKGRIVALQVDGDRVRDHRVVLEQPNHLSYPYLFEHDEVLYMIPESNGSATVSLWRCRRFPDDWEHVHEILVGIQAADSTLLMHEGRCYLFTTLARNDSMDRSTELHIFHASHPLAREWRAHPANPVAVDCRSARMAGSFITGTDGSLIRCAQYHGAQYGQAITLRRVMALSPDTYQEEPVGAVEPQWEHGLTGTHHLSSRHGVVCIDACTPLPRWRRSGERATALARAAGDSARDQALPGATAHSATSGPRDSGL